MRKFVYPVDTDQFKKIRENKKVYVDKTEYIYNLVNEDKYQYVFLARPRRFGKSLLCNTMKAYFQGQKELFEGLKIMELEKEWRKHPVLHFILSGLKNVTVPLAQSKLGNLISDYEKIYGCNPELKTPGARFRNLIHNAYQQTGEEVVVLLDEYDAAIMQLMYDHTQLDKMRAMLREFYQVLKDEGEYLKFVFITGVTKFSQLSIFSELNNLKQISMIDKYSGICGITQRELNTTLRPCVEDFASHLNISTEEAYTLLKRNYDGYHFSKTSEEVYAPYSLLNALNDNTIENYWFDSGTSSSLIEHLQHFPTFNPLDYDGIDLTINAFSTPCEKADTPIPLLYQSGYLTIKNYDTKYNTYTLHFPNYEVRQGLVGNMSGYLMDTNELERDNTTLSMARAINNGDLSSALIEFRSYIASLPYDVITKKEWMSKQKREAFYKMLIYIVFSLLDSRIDTEVKSILGRADVVIRTESDIYVLELKVDNSVDNALAQIDSKSYAIPYTTDGRKITKCGIAISSEQRNIVHWRAVDINGIVIDEQKF